LVLEQELASIMRFILDATDSPAPYYHTIPEDFLVPSVYFPTPEITSDGETFLTYRLDYVWYISFFHSTTEDAYAMAHKALTAIKEARNLIPLISDTGAATGKGLRTKDPELKKVADGAYRLVIEFASRRPYRKSDAELAQNFTVNQSIKPNFLITREIEVALESAVEQFLTDYPPAGGAAAGELPKR